MSDVRGKLVGFRSWRPSDDLMLGSTGVGTGWERGPNTAKCLTLYGHDAPNRLCTCGLYALHQPDDATAWGGEIVGAVTAWGRIQVHADGFRAEHAEVVLLAQGTTPRAAVVVDAVAKRYGIATVPRSELSALAAFYGQPVPDELLPSGTDAHEYPYPRVTVPLPGPDHQAAIERYVEAAGFPAPAKPWWKFGSTKEEK